LGGEEGVEANDVFVDVIGPFALEKHQWTEDESADDRCQEGDADETPEIEKALFEERAEASGRVCLIAEECAGNEKKVDEEVERDGKVTGLRSGVPDGAFMEMQVGFADGAEIEAAGEALGGERVIQQFGELEVEADREEEGEGEIEDVGPEKSGKATQSKR
jgi:hypothetical protein